MSRFPPFSRYETGAASARVRDLLVRLRLHMRDEAILDEAIARLATELNVRPGEAAEQLARMAKHSGLELVEVARGIERPLTSPGRRTRCPPGSPACWRPFTPPRSTSPPSGTPRAASWTS
ncbi:hypothetical protein ACFQ0B_22525 [Nonomuraea thailandensis]